MSRLPCKTTLENSHACAAKQNYVQIVELLANRENRIPNAQGTTALMIAASKNFVEIVRLLYRMESEMKDIYNETALMKAAKAGALDAAALLLEAEAGMAREDGKTAMMCAAEMDRMEMVDLLLKKGVQQSDEGRNHCPNAGCSEGAQAHYSTFGTVRGEEAAGLR